MGQQATSEKVLDIDTLITDSLMHGWVIENGVLKPPVNFLYNHYATHFVKVE